MTFEERLEAQKTKNNWHRIGWRQGYEDRKNGQWAEPDDRHINEPGFTDGYYAGFHAQDVIAKHSAGIF